MVSLSILTSHVSLLYFNQQQSFILAMHSQK
ncbi:unnamed protein product [Spirodela intermedia]|uniref:Uncharacterized protein n=2 Tax=Spirodela intermedia TaxID=51605 RepID=A0A7I8J2C4_SPIIN|nr:unnamed protein product [Spirodela intermedia]CAA6664308.1 unnamed protein product [Spirodela intermedia]CAA7400876.1 unnamed protein product [Spirodela intermedia]